MRYVGINLFSSAVFADMNTDYSALGPTLEVSRPSHNWMTLRPTHDYTQTRLVILNKDESDTSHFSITLLPGGMPTQERQIRLTHPGQTTREAAGMRSPLDSVFVCC